MGEIMTSSTKPEVHNVSQRRQRTEPRPHRKSGEVRSGSFRDMRADRQTHRQTDKQTDVLITRLRIALIGRSNDRTSYSEVRIDTFSCMHGAIFA